ncbi:MAG: FHA domain-containing protein [Planctomycetes bacterium]|nr:FHA domain-containing protein [Planctomycetota bacterium]MCB9935559.1 FHA domain-containing protein [Planctomycetota bacterium]
MKLLISIHGQVREYTPEPNLGIISVGRGDGNDVILDGEKGASRKHLTLERMVDGWKLVDQMSANGTAVNGEKVNFAFLKENDVIQIGSTKIQVTGLNPTPGARPAPARPVRRAEAPMPVGDGAEIPAGPPIPRRKSPVPALVAAAVIVLVLGVGGYVVVSSIGGGGQPAPEVADKGPEVPRQAALTDDEKAALALAREVADGSGGNLEKIHRLDGIQENLKSKLAGKRGSKALSDIADMKSRLVAGLDSEVSGRVENELQAVEQHIAQNEFAMAMARLDGLSGWFESDTLLAGFANAHRSRVAKARKQVETENSGFLGRGYDQMWKLSGQGRHEEALAVCDDLLKRAWLEAADREVYETERRKLEAARTSKQPEGPVVEEPAKGPSILDKVKKDEGRLPGKNPLLPDGARSEQKLLAALHTRLVNAAKGKTLTSELFEWKGKKAKIRGADEKKLTLEVVSIDKKTREELVYRTSAKWEDVLPEDMLQLYDRTPGLSDEDRLAVVIYCFEHAFMDEASRRALALWKLRNDWKEGIDTLIASKRKISIPTDGFVEYDNALVTPEEKENAIFYANLRGVLERFEKGVGHKDRKKAEDAEKAFAELLNMGERAVKPAIEILQGVLDKELGNAKKATGLMAADKTRMDGLLAELDRRREYALELIMDTERYPYPYGPNQAEVQADVDERVAAVREIWNDPAKFSGQTNPEFDAIMGKVRSIAERMAQIDPEQKYFKQTPEETVEYISNIANEALSIRNYTGDDTAKQALYNTNIKVMQYNEDFPTGEGHADAESREQVRITNEYRIMFARVALKINDKLFWAAHHHSRYCVEQNGGQIAHVIPGEPRGEGPGDRMKYEGYPAGGGENIHMNSGGPTARSSHDSWCHSSGHHRNILTPGWRVLGSAKWKTIWTQCFGGLDEGDGNTVSKGGE